MNPKLTFLFYILVAFSATSICLAQTADTKVSVRFVDTSGQPVTPETALFYNGGHGKPISVEGGQGEVPSGRGIVVAKADGFQFSGTVLSGSDGKVVFYRDSEPCEALVQSAFPLTDEIKSKVIEALKENLWEKVKDQPEKPTSALQIVGVLAMVDPKGALAWLEENELPGQMGMMIQQPSLLAMMRTDTEEAFDLISQIEDSTMQSMVLGVFLEKLPADDPAMQAVESRRLEVSRSVKQPAMRLAMRASMAEHYSLTGRPELADKIVQQHLEEAKKLPSGGWSAYPRSLFAALIVEQDPELALELIKVIGKQNESTRAQARVAFSCCRTNPDLAIKLLSLYVPDENTITVWRHSIKITHRMAVEQTDAARKLADSIDEPNQRAWALGLMAMRLNKSDTATAKELLAEAIDALSAPAARNQQWFPVGGTLAGLLPIAQEVDPAKVRPMIWQAVFETLPRTRWVEGTSNKVKIQSVAGAIARFDRDLATALVGQTEVELGNMFAESAARQALLDPSGLVEYTDRLCSQDTIRQNRMLTKLTDLVTQSENDFWDSISKPGMLNWPSEKFEEF